MYFSADKLLKLILCIFWTLLCITSYFFESAEGEIHHRFLRIPQINIQLYGDIPTLISSKFTRLNKRGVSLPTKKIPTNDNNTILISAVIYDDNENPREWDESLSDPQSAMHQLLSEAYCQFLLHAFQASNVSKLQQPECTFLQFKKGSIISEALFTFDTSVNIDFSLNDMLNILMNGMKSSTESLMNGQPIRFAFSFGINGLSDTEAINYSQATIELPQGDNMTWPNMNYNNSSPGKLFCNQKN
ncbi:unnamed protein product [Heterobilharzia americana]|nr:unnamed protein product [Heterobilharzia americana]